MRARLAAAVAALCLLAACSQSGDDPGPEATPTAEQPAESPYAACDLVSDDIASTLLDDDQLTRSEESHGEDAETELACSIQAASGGLLELRATLAPTRAAAFDAISCASGRDLEIDGVTARECADDPGPRVLAAWPTAADGGYTLTLRLPGASDTDIATRLTPVVAGVADRLVTSDFFIDPGDSSSCAVLDPDVVDDTVGATPVDRFGNEFDPTPSQRSRNLCTIDVSPELLVAIAWRTVDPYNTGQLQPAGCFQSVRILGATTGVTCVRQPDDGVGGHIVAEGVWERDYVSVAVHRTDGPEYGDREMATRIATHVHDRMATKR